MLRHKRTTTYKSHFISNWNPHTMLSKHNFIMIKYMDEKKTRNKSKEKAAISTIPKIITLTIKYTNTCLT